MQAVNPRKSNRDNSISEQFLARKRVKTQGSSEMENGDTLMHGNGNVTDGQTDAHPEFLGTRCVINKKEFIRLLEQSLYSLGFRKAARELEQASGIDCEPGEVRTFRHAVTEGSWDRAVKLLSDLQFADDDALKKAKFLVLQEKYLEASLSRLQRQSYYQSNGATHTLASSTQAVAGQVLMYLLFALQALAKGNTVKAVKCLRMELTPLQFDTVRLHQLANAIMCQDEEDLQKTLSWPGPEKGSRQQLLNSLQVSISHSWIHSVQNQCQHNHAIRARLHLF